MPTRANPPWLTLSLIAVNIGLAFVLFVNPDLAFSYGFRAQHPNLLDAFASMFLHLNLVHLMGNMLFLAAVGPLVEYAGGRRQLALVYLLGGLAGVGAFWLLASGPDPLLIGASGAISACLAYVSVRYIRLRVPLLPGIGTPVWAIAGLWMGLQLLGAVWRLGDEGGGVSFWTHLGGFLAGLILSPILGATKQASQELGHEVLDQMNERGPAATLHAAERMLQKHPNDLRALRHKAEALRDLHEPKKEAAAWLELLAKSPEADQAGIVEELASCGGLEAVEPIERAKLADRLKDSSPTACRTILESLVRQKDDAPTRPEALLALATLIQGEEPEQARKLTEELSAKYSLHGAAAVARAKGMIP